MDMSRVAPVVPEESDLLCEGCGYTLNGLPAAGNCPECGKPIEESIGQHRHVSPFERMPSLRTFAQTVIQMQKGHRQFFVGLTTRSRSNETKLFALINQAVAAALFALAATGHLLWGGIVRYHPWQYPLVVWWLSFIVLFLVLKGLTWLAGWLSALEARYWGMRLPFDVVKRGLQFHSADYLPVAIFAIVIVWGYRLLLVARVIDRSFDMAYLYVCCGAVIVSAIYLFQTYWIAMRSMMYANR